jgi:hypothetical protein
LAEFFHKCFSLNVREKVSESRFQRIALRGGPHHPHSLGQQSFINVCGNFQVEPFSSAIWCNEPYIIWFIAPYFKLPVSLFPCATVPTVAGPLCENHSLTVLE